MNTKDIKKDDMVEVQASTLMSLVLSQIRGKVLFPEKIKAAKKELRLINKKLKLHSV